MQNTWPVSNKKFEEHVVDPQAHNARFNAIEADYEAQIKSEEIRASRVEAEIEARSLNRYKDACGKITTEQTRAESVETGLSERITSEVGTLRADHNQLSDTVDGLQNLPHVIECGSNEYGSYRKWSNGDIEQYGSSDGTRGDSKLTINFPTAFISTQYCVNFTPLGAPSETGTRYNRYISSKAVDHVVFCDHMFGLGVTSCDWYAIGKWK